MPYSSNATLEEVEMARLAAAKQRHALEASIGLVSLNTHISKKSPPTCNNHNHRCRRSSRKINCISPPVQSRPKRSSARLQIDAPPRERYHKMRGDRDNAVVLNEKQRIWKQRKNYPRILSSGHSQNRSKKYSSMRERKVDMMEYNIKSEEHQQSPALDHIPIVILPGPPDSSKNLKCNVKLLLDEYLGYPFAECGKEHVMKTCSTTATPKFSKMAAIVEWSNAVFLWVNIDGKEYDNVFQQVDGEVRMTWFGGSRHRMNTPMIQRLLQLREGDAMEKKCGTTTTDVKIYENDSFSVDVNAGATTSNNSNSNPSTNSLAVMHNHHRFLFCRISGEPYTCFGRLVLRDFNGTTLPLSFTWALMDYDTLVRNLERGGSLEEPSTISAASSVRNCRATTTQYGSKPSSDRWMVLDPKFH